MSDYSSIEQLEMCTTLFFYTSQFKTRQLTWIDMYELNHGLRKSNTDIHCIFLVHSIPIWIWDGSFIVYMLFYFRGKKIIFLEKGNCFWED